MLGGIVVPEDPLDEVSPVEDVSPEDDPSVVPDEGVGVLQMATGGTVGAGVVGDVSACAAAGSATAIALTAATIAAHL